MSQAIVISVEAPYVTAKRYAELSGMNLNTITKKIKDGKIPVMSKDGSRELNLINLALLTKRALEAKY
ncbi:excisionase [Aliivibrio kagoshimensis]|uniref:excisionase n=1 Tax=Aliivibrio kagoshimensis TaxID=2910230 RepID=UPI003D0E5E11